MKRIIGIVIILAILSVGGWYVFRMFVTTNDGSSQEVVTDAITTSEYSNTAYGYTIAYPMGYTLTEYTPEITSIGLEQGELFSTSVDITIQSVQRGEEFPVSIRDFNEFAAYRAQQYCAADGPGVSIGCTNVTRLEPFTTRSGLPGIKLFFKRETIYFDTKSTTTVEVGPIYVIDISSKNPDNVYTAIIIHNQLAGDEFSEQDLNLAATVAESLSVK